jgi:sugar phosphate isomerase/epimerase
MLLGYNTNGMAHHHPFQAVELLAEIGYTSVAITLDHGPLDPYDGEFTRRLAQMRRLLERLGMRSVIETGARYLLDPRHKHAPTLMTAEPAGRARRIDFLRRAIDAAHLLSSDCVSLWSGSLVEPIPEAEAFERLRAGLSETLDYALQRGVTLGFEPEPGMFIDTMQRYGRLLGLIDAPHFRLTLDVGHLHCQGELPLADQVRRWAGRLVNVHLEDMRRGVHEHLMFDEGEIDFPPVLAALSESGYAGAVHVELSRHSHQAPEAARRAFEFLQPIWPVNRDRRG